MSQPVIVAIAAVAVTTLGAFLVAKCFGGRAKKSALPGGLTQADVANLRRTWAMVKGDLKAVAGLFYGNLFSANPDFPKTLFKNVDMTAQGGRLMTMVGSGVALIDQPEKLIPVLQASGVRHVAYGCEEAQYRAVGAAFLKTLREGLGAAFTPEVESAWTKYYTVAAQVMIDAQNSPQGRAQLAAADLRRRNRMVQDSWELVTSADDFTQRFYHHLFTANPSLPQTAFKGVNMSEQRKKLASMIDGGVKLLNRVDELVPVLKACGARHVRYGTKPEHYPLVGAALLATLRDTLGAKFTPELEKEWTRVYGLMADTMIAGAASA